MLTTMHYEQFRSFQMSRHSGNSLESLDPLVMQVYLYIYLFIYLFISIYLRLVDTALFCVHTYNICGEAHGEEQFLKAV